MIFESRVDISKIWYFGNNKAKDLKLSPPKWHSPFFLTTDYNYAEEYSDYGVYTITLKGEAKSKILDFSKDSDVKKLKWPKKLIDEIRTGKSDLNAIAYDMYILCGLGGGQLWRLSNGPTWRAIAHQFDQKSRNLLHQLPPNASWGQDKDHRFVLQMWKDIHDASFDGFTHVEFGKQILALFDFKCMDKISVQSVKAVVNEKLKSRALRKAFNARGQAAFPKIKSDDDIVFISGIPKKKALHLLKRACHDVSNFHPEYMKKAVKWSDDQIFGVFNKHDKRNVLAMASVSCSEDESGAAYLHEMTGFIKGGYGKKLVEHLLHKFKKVYGQIALEGSGTNSDPFRPNEKLRDKFYATIPGLKIYRVQNSIWDCPADFFYYGISDESIKKFLEKTYSSKEHTAINENESLCQTMYRFSIDNVGVYEAAKDLIFSAFNIDEAKRKWSEVLAASSWLPKPGFQYSKEYESWFTLAGKTMFEKTVLPIIEKIGIYSVEMQKSTIVCSRIVYSDIYQAIVKLDKINEDSHQFYDIDKNDEVVADGKLKIWVDDVRPAPSGYMWVKSVNEFVDVVEHAGLESVEVVDIDHDAGDFYHDGGDYIRILDYLEFLDAKDVQVRIHSANPVGVANMRRIIRKNGWTELFDVVEEDEDTRSTSVSSIDQMFNDVIEKYYAVFGIDLTYMKFKVDSQPVYTNGQPCYEYDEDECAGDWTSLKWIRLNPDMKSVMDRYGVSGDVSQFTKIIIAHELAHEVWNNIADDQFKKEILDEARRQSFNTVYLDTVRPSKLPEEIFCEYLAHKITQNGFSSADNQKLNTQKK